MNTAKIISKQKMNMIDLKINFLKKVLTVNFGCCILYYRIIDNLK